LTFTNHSRNAIAKLLSHLYQRRKAYFINTIRDKVNWGVEDEHVFGVCGGSESARGAHRNSKAQSAFLDG
jgi:hypothetical protein